ncbi:MAG: hypothetical protein V2A34_01535 [Lentisphaerota bacterium]
MSSPIQLNRCAWMCAVIFLVVIAAGEMTARRLLPVVPGCSEAPRNPFRFRGWPEYMAGVETTGASARLLLISNSQAYSGEQPASKSYPAILQRTMTERHIGGFPSWNVLNWSIDGTTSMEYMLMAADARQADPAMVLAVVGFADFRAANNGKGFAFCRSDVPRLAARWRVVKNLPVAFVRRHFKVEDILTSWISDQLAMRRLRDYGWSWLDVRFPGAQNMFYAPLVSYRFWEIKAKPLVPPARFPVRNGEGEELLDFTYDERSTVLLREYLQQLSRLPCKVVVVSAPVRAGSQDKRLVFQQRFQEDLARLAPECELTLWNMQDALTRVDFITSSHFNVRNHELFARLLAERIQGETGR